MDDLKIYQICHHSITYFATLISPKKCQLGPIFRTGGSIKLLLLVFPLVTKCLGEFGLGQICWWSDHNYFVTFLSSLCLPFTHFFLCMFTKMRAGTTLSTRCRKYCWGCKWDTQFKFRWYSSNWQWTEEAAGTHICRQCQFKETNQLCTSSSSQCNVQIWWRWGGWWGRGNWFEKNCFEPVLGEMT